MLDRVIGNIEPVKALQAAVATRKLPHAILLTGADGLGRGFVSRLLAADYLFPDGGAAAEAVLRGESSEVLLVTGEGKSGQIPVARIREVRQDIYLSSLSSTIGRVVLVHNAHLMAAPAANALLKVLEEPPNGALFILTAISPSSVPLTIQSRCSLYSLAPVSNAEFANYLKDFTNSSTNDFSLEQLAIIFSGRIGAGMQVLQNASYSSILKDALSAAKAALQKDKYNLLRVFAAYEGRADGDREKRERLLAYLSNILLAVFHADAVQGLPASSPANVAILLPHVSKTRSALASNASPKMAFTVLAANLASKQ